MQDSLLNGRSSLLGAMCWMIGLSFILGILLGWVPVLGHLAAGILAGYVGGRRAGTAGRALGASILPCVFSFFVCSGLGVALGAVGRDLGIGTLIGGLVGLFTGLVLFVHHAALIIAAVVGGVQRQSEPY